MYRMFPPHATKLNIQFDTLCGQGLLQGLKPGHSKSESCLLPPKAGAHPPKLSQAMRVLANAELSEKVVKVEIMDLESNLTDRRRVEAGCLPQPAPPLPSSPSLNSSEHVSTVLQQVNSSPIGATGSNRLPSIIRCYIHSFHSASAFSGTWSDHRCCHHPFLVQHGPRPELTKRQTDSSQNYSLCQLDEGDRELPSWYAIKRLLLA
ncbi:hypothetical protein F5879DRAFT_974314 [Lentinula edodes]|nr:hypothetical protein F5879DRAFT_974314 [Lentinula edodes]